MLRDHEPASKLRRTEKVGLNAALAAHIPLVAIGVGDALEARIAERAGFDLLWISSLAVATRLACPEDECMWSLGYDRVVAEVAGATRLPAILDANLSSLSRRQVQRRIKRWADLGISAICIEDKDWPKTNSLDWNAPQRLLPDAKLVHLMRSVRTAAGDRMSIIARIDALVAGWRVEEVLQRMKVCAHEGADLIIVHSRAPDPREVLSVLQRWEGVVPVGLIPTTYPSFSEADAAALKNCRLLIYANQLLRVAIRSQEELLEEIKRSGGLSSSENRLCQVERVFDLQKPLAEKI